ncbi:MAG: hypothetical protein ABIR55_15450 [Burkholderiaceae bacterium]
MTVWPRLRRAGAVVLAVAILAITLYELQRQAVTMDWPALRVAFSRIGAFAVLESVLATAASFMGLALIEAWAVRKHPGVQVSSAVAMATGAASHALAHVLGWHVVLGVLVRRRAYGAAPPQLLGILVAVGAAVFAGTVAMLAIGVACVQSHWAGWLVLGLLVALTMLGRRGGAATSMPNSMRWSLRQLQAVAAILPVSLLEAAAALTALWVLVPLGTFASWPVFVVTCILAQALGVFSHVPGGLGVFEAAMLASVPADARPGLLAAILAYRALYGLLPFATLGVPWLLWSSLHPKPAPATTSVDQLDGG